MGSTAVALLLLGTVACVFSAEHTGAVELGEASAGQSDVADMSGAKVAKGKDPRDELMTPWDKQGLKVIDAYANYNAKLQDDEKGLRKKLANPPDKTEATKYHEIRGYKFAYLGKELKDQSKSECELVCSSYEACKSFSYNEVSRTCIWSMSTVGWDTDYVLYEKKGAPGLNPNELYARMPGLKIQDKILPLKRGSDHVDVRGKTVEIPAPKSVSLEECKYACTKQEKCRTFSYAARGEKCLLSAIRIHYNKAWDYFEKHAPLEAAPWEVAHAKENKEKDELKKAWVAGSTPKARAKAERAAKVEEEIVAIKKRAKTSKELVAKAIKVKNAAMGDCDLAKTTWEGYNTQNQVLMASVEKRTSSVAALKVVHSTIMGEVKSAANFEIKEKAELKLKTVNVQSAKDLLASARTSEKEIKGTIASANKIKIQKCGVMKLTVDEWKGAKAAMIQAEAADVYLTSQEKTTAAGKKLTEKDNRLTEATSSERRAKATMMVMKGNENSAKKANKEATSEKLKKSALTEQSAAQESLQKTTEELENVDNMRRVKKESQQKAKETYTKAKEKESKAENQVKTKKREASMKQETIVVNQRIRAKQEGQSKSEAINKAAKKQELLKRKHEETVEKGKVKLERLSVDESTKKNEIKNDEKKYKDLSKSKELNDKANETKNKRLQELSKAEQDSKYAIRKATLTKQVLAENEADTKKKVKQAEQDAAEAKMKAGSDELKEKDAAVALKKATTEKSTKKLMRTELNWKSVSSKSNELVTKADQQKMLMVEDNTQAQSKMQANICVETCREGLKMKQKEFMAKQANPLKKAPAAQEELLQLGEDAEEAKKTLSPAVMVAMDSEVQMMPPVTAFKYKGCQC